MVARGRGRRAAAARIWHDRRVTVAAKLQIRADQSVCVLGLPDGVDLDLPPDTPGAEAAAADVVIAFAARLADLDGAARPAVEAARRDALAWIAYPKARALGTDLTRDVLAAAALARGVQPVRQIAIDDTWSALRFRPHSA
jgi:hypothetical protein